MKWFTEAKVDAGLNRGVWVDLTAPGELQLPLAAEFFPILAWGGPPTTHENYRELADAGFTWNLTAVGTADAAAKALDVAKARGVKPRKRQCLHPRERNATTRPSR